jgi:hypothetical protein
MFKRLIHTNLHMFFKYVYLISVNPCLILDFTTFSVFSVIAVATGSSTNVEYIRQIHLILQNEPNLDWA